MIYKIKSMKTINNRNIVLKNNKEVLLRPALTTDSKAFHNLLIQVRDESTFLSASGEEFLKYNSQEDISNEIKTIVDSSTANLIVAVYNDKLVGYVEITPKWGEWKTRLIHVANLSIAILSEYAGSGLGKALMREAISWTKQHPVITKLHLSFHETNKIAKNMYEKLGFIEEGRLIGEMNKQGTLCDVILMYLPV